MTSITWYQNPAAPPPREWEKAAADLKGYLSHFEGYGTSEGALMNLEILVNTIMGQTVDLNTLKRRKP